tara:strand:- start:193 stop:411 length:219 start_codon:yes stop_codon:yes gene_type:complete
LEQHDLAVSLQHLLSTILEPHLPELELSQDLEQSSEQHVKLITPYVKTAKKAYFHIKFNLSFKSITSPYYIN